MILDKDVEQLSVININTNEEIAVITDDSVTTASGEIVVRIRFKPQSKEEQQGKDVDESCAANEIFLKLEDGFIQGIASAIRDSGEESS